MRKTVFLIFVFLLISTFSFSYTYNPYHDVYTKWKTEINKRNYSLSSRKMKREVKRYRNGRISIRYRVWDVIYKFKNKTDDPLWVKISLTQQENCYLRKGGEVIKIDPGQTKILAIVTRKSLKKRMSWSRYLEFRSPQGGQVRIIYKGNYAELDLYIAGKAMGKIYNGKPRLVHIKKHRAEISLLHGWVRHSQVVENISSNQIRSVVFRKPFFTEGVIITLKGKYSWAKVYIDGKSNGVVNRGVPRFINCRASSVLKIIVSRRRYKKFFIKKANISIGRFTVNFK